MEEINVISLDKIISDANPELIHLAYLIKELSYAVVALKMQHIYLKESFNARDIVISIYGDVNFYLF